MLLVVIMDMNIRNALHALILYDQKVLIPGKTILEDSSEKK
jgi:hypothetical protein